MDNEIEKSNKVGFIDKLDVDWIVRSRQNKMRRRKDAALFTTQQWSGIMRPIHPVNPTGVFSLTKHRLTLPFYFITQRKAGKSVYSFWESFLLPFRLSKTCMSFKDSVPPCSLTCRSYTLALDVVSSLSLFGCLVMIKVHASTASLSPIDDDMDGYLIFLQKLCKRNAADWKC